MFPFLLAGIIVNACARRLGSRAPGQDGIAAPPSDWGGSHRAGGGGGIRKFCIGMPDPGLLVPDASRQEAEANIWVL